jgi:t-SNARE complex subunit (syntaxin)
LTSFFSEILTILSEFAVTIAAATLISIVFTLFTKFLKPKKGGETIKQRIGRLSASLKEAVELINRIESEIKARQVLVSKLEKDIETSKKIAALKQAEVEAVAQVFRGELQTESRRSLWRDIAVNVVFFLFGVVFTILIRGL